MGAPQPQQTNMQAAMAEFKRVNGGLTPTTEGARIEPDAATAASILSTPKAPGDPRDTGLAKQAGAGKNGSSILGTQAGILGVGAQDKKSILGG